MSRAMYSGNSNDIKNVSQDEHQPVHAPIQDFSVPPPPLPFSRPGYSAPNMQVPTPQCLSSALMFPNQQSLIQIPSFPPPMNYQAATVTSQEYFYPSLNNVYSTPSNAPPFYGEGHLYENSHYQLESTNKSKEIVSNETVESSDRSWIQKWHADCIKKKDKKSLPSNVSLKISEAKLVIKQCLKCLLELKNIKAKMAKNCIMLGPEQWNSMYTIVKCKQEQVINCLTQLSNAHDLKKSIHRRCKKRLAQKLQRIKRKERKLEDSERRQHMHHQIDAWLHDMQGRIEKTKQEESLKKEADSVLSEVIRKKAEARRQLSLLKNLIKLRKLRAKSAANRGQHTTSDDRIRFMKVAEHLKHLWEKQLQEYNIEEQGMKVMLNEAVDERDQTRVSREKQILLQWDHLLFGHEKHIPEFYTAAERDIDAFINNRKCWDQFIASNDASVKSSIPVGWVLPSNPSSEDWETLLSKE